MDYKTMKFPDIYNWCKENGKLAWLEAKVSEDMEVEVYPFTTYTDKNGKERRKYDKSVAPTIETRPISFLLVKEAFVAKFMPELKPQAKPNGGKTMRDWFK